MIQPFQQRVINEKAELDTRIDKLVDFIAGGVYPTLEAHERDRLIRQRLIMHQYSLILAERIEHFKVGE